MIWKKTIEIKYMLNDYNDKKIDIKELKKLIKEKLKKYNYIDDIIILKLKSIKNENQFNKWLDIFFDFCDVNKIWVK